MKIRTITCHDVCNYGASLQALALQTYIEELGHEVKIIDYVPDYCKPYNIWNIHPSSHLYKVSKYSFFFKLFCAARNYMQVRSTLPRRKSFAAFNKRFLKLTDHYNSYKELSTTPPIADAYIAGSDQIWRTNLNNGKDPAFYMQFGKDETKRYSYAASFGLPYLTDGMDFLVKTYLSKLNAISVRESSGVEIVRNLGLEAKLVVDPVFLLNKDEWFSLLDIKESLIKEPYVLVYDLNHRNMKEQKMEFARLCSSNGLKVVAVNNIRKTNYAEVNICDAGPIEFVNLIANAQLVLSDSFHATAFSIIMHTPFRVYFDSPQASRISDFLELLHLDHCMNCNDNSDYKFDWERIQFDLDEMIISSKDYLKSVLNAK